VASISTPKAGGPITIPTKRPSNSPFLLSTRARHHQACSPLILSDLQHVHAQCAHKGHCVGRVAKLTKEVCLLAIFGVLPELSIRERGFLVAFASSARRRLLSILRAGREDVREP